MVHTLADAVTAPTAIDFSQPIHDAVTQSTALLTNNIAYLFAIPIAFVGFGLAKKLLAKVKG